MNWTYECTECKKTYNRNTVRYLCPECKKNYQYGEPLRGVLKVVFDYEYIKKTFNKNNPDWSLFSAVEQKFFPNYSVGNTPFIQTKRLGEILNCNNLWIKNDGLNPSGSLKDRASFLVVAEANRLNENTIVTASTGNAASALAAVCASEGKTAKIFVPKTAPIAKLTQIKQYGAELNLVDGTYDDAFRLSLEYTEGHGGLNRNTAYHPLTIEGKKTAGMEIFAQNNFIVPDAIIIPVGDGVIISGIYKAFLDLKMSGITNKMPKLIAVQAEKSNALHNLLTTGSYKNANDPSTIADSISVCTPSNIWMAKEAVETTQGFSVLVSDTEILEAQKLLSSTTGVFAEPAAASTLAALQKTISENAENKLDKNSQIVLLITGHGLKDIEAATKIFN